jgi:hypothetical protein
MQTCSLVSKGSKFLVSLVDTISDLSNYVIDTQFCQVSIALDESSVKISKAQERSDFLTVPSFTFW